MKKATYILPALLAVLALSASPAFSQSHSDKANPGSTTPTSNSDGWIKFKSDEGRYSVSVPAAPSLSTQESTNDSGMKFTQYMATTLHSGRLYMIGYFDFPATFDLDKARDGVVGRLKATLENETAISLGGYPGRELKLRSKDDNGSEYVIRARIYAIKNRAYFVQFITDASDNDPSATGQAQRYFDSFSVTVP